MSLSSTGTVARVPGRFYIQNFGCQMNEYDAARMAEILVRQGYERASSPEEADILIVNTCAIREKAEARGVETVRRFQDFKKDRRCRVLALAGCVAQHEGARLLEQLPGVDLVFGPDSIVKLPLLLRDVEERSTRVASLETMDREDYLFLSAEPHQGEVGVSALVTVQKGCDNHCAYCVVPHTRGPEVSRPAREVCEEVARFVAAGAREITLIGQNVNAYRGLTGQVDDFVRLLRLVADTPGLMRLRFTTSHPKDFSPELARAFAEVGTLQPWLHLPVQSGSTRVLAAMRRGYTREEYLRKVDLVRRFVPDIGLTTDVIVGFPGETEEDFRDTMRLLDEVGFESIYSFAYSQRPGTPAALLADDVPREDKLARLHELQRLQESITARRLRRFLGSCVEVLVEGESRYGGQACGRTPENVMVNVVLPEGVSPVALTGSLMRVRVTEIGSHTLRGEQA